jgi:Alpha/beta hydrolase domain containing 18
MRDVEERHLPMTSRVLPHSEIEQVLRASLGRLLFRPWFDRAALAALGNWVFPASRLWAAAELAGDDVESFVALTPALHGVRLQRGVLGRSLVELSKLRRRAAASEQRWDEAFFAPRAGQEALERADAARLRDGRLYLGSRMGFMTLARRARVPAVIWAIPDEAATTAALGAVIASPQSIYAGVPAQAIIESKRLRKRSRTEFVLRFALPDGVGGALQARVFEPAGIADPPTVIHCHGFGMEPDHINNGLDEFMPLVRAGVRLVRVTAPWHGSRREMGTWSGEPFLASVPVGAVTMLGTAVRELSALIAWARATSKGRVGLSGVSMGALTVQLAAVHMAHWPVEQRADALFLVGTSDRLDRIAFESALTRTLGLDAALRVRGWTADSLRRFGALTNPEGEPAIARESIFVVLGTADDVTPFDGGVALAARWRVPADNQFRRPQGHFSLSQGLIPDNAPLLRFAAHLQRRL